MGSNVRDYFRTNLNYYLEKSGHTQLELSEAIGVSTATVSEWCNGKKLPRMNKIEEIANWLGLSISDLLEDRSESEKHYYLDEATRAIADEIKNNDELALLFDAARDASPEDLETVHQMLLALKRKERHDD